MGSTTNLPPIIEHWISEIKNPKTNIHIRDNYRQMLELVRDNCTTAIQQFNIEKYSAETKAAKAK